MVSDAMSLQFRMPPLDAGRPVAQVTASVAFGTPVVDLLLLGPVWAVAVMRGLAQVSQYAGQFGLKRRPSSRHPHTFI